MKYHDFEMYKSHGVIIYCHIPEVSILEEHDQLVLMLQALLELFSRYSKNGLLRTVRETINFSYRWLES